MRSKLITIPIYELRIKLFKMREKEKVKYQGVNISTEKSHSLVFYEPNKPIKIFASFNIDALTHISRCNTIAHEALHVTHFIMQHKGIKPDIDNDEAQAYLVGYIAEQIDKFLKEDYGL